MTAKAEQSKKILRIVNILRENDEPPENVAEMLVFLTCSFVRTHTNSVEDSLIILNDIEDEISKMWEIEIPSKKKSK